VEAPVLARDLMSTPVHTIMAEATIGDAAEAMMKAGKSCLLGVNREGGIVGIITPANLSFQRKFLPMAENLFVLLGEWTSSKDLEATAHEIRSRPIKGIMTQPVVTSTPDAPVSALLDLMARENVSHLPIIEGKELMGIITRHDFVKLLLK
jgi:tRNA nucleotidyltransferase (CCA-adding enzyme)